MSYCEFLDILKQERLALKYPGKWPDNLEMLFLKQFDDRSKLNNLVENYAGLYPEYSNYDVKSDLQILTVLLMKTRCQCWTYKEDDLIMWNERNSQETVRIGVVKSSFDKYDNSRCGGHVSHNDVNYVKRVSVESILKRFNDSGRKYPTFVLDKKDVYSYESEHRVILSPNDYFSNTQSHGNTIEEFLQRHFYGVQSEFNRTDKYIPFDIKNITDVKVNPYATEQFENLVKQDCEQFGLTYNGISKVLL